MPIPTLPTPPSRADSATFAARTDAFLGLLPNWTVEANALQADVTFKYNYVVAAYQAAGGIGAAMSTAAASAQQASAASDRALAAWGAATAPAETLAAMSQVTHIGAVVDTLIVDTSRDSAEWRKRCQHTSWYNRTLGGDRSIAPQATVAAAWAAAGNATGAVFLASSTAGPIVAGRFYTATSATAATEVFEGVSRDIPAMFQMIVEAGRVVFYDLTAPGCPMWRVLVTSSSNRLLNDLAALTSVAYSQGQVFIGSAGGLWQIDFARDMAHRAWTGSTGNTGVFLGGLGAWNTVMGYSGANRYNIINGTVNDIAATVLTDALSDPATGLTVPNVAVATAGGVSELQNDGTVKNSLATHAFSQVSYARDGALLMQSGVGSNLLRAALPRAAGFGTTAYSFASIPAVANASAPNLVASDSLLRGSLFGLELIKENPSNLALGMVARITKDYNTGWCVGDNRLAMADTVAETINGGELGTNSAAITSATGWAGANGASVAYAAGEITATNTTATYGRFATPTFSAIAGKTYAVKVTVSGSSQRACNGVSLFDGFNPASGNSPPIAIGQSLTFNLTATASGNLSVRGEIASLVIGESATVSSISIKQVEADRSPRNIGLLPIGPLQKTQVALAAQLVAYGVVGIAGDGTFTSGALAYTGNAFSGFFGSDFVIQSWMEGDADFYINSAAPVGFPWTATTGDGHTLSRSGAPGTKGVVLAKVVAGVRTGLSSGIATPTASGWNLWTIVRRSGVLSVWLGDQLVGSQTLAAGSATDLGFYFGVTGRFALFRASATAPSADDIAKTYRDELPRFQPGAQDTLAGTSSAVTAIAYDDVTDITCVVTGTHRNDMKGLMRVGVEALTVGTGTSVSAQRGVISTAGSTGARTYMPALTLREELKRKDEARAVLGRVPWVIPFDAIAGQTVFPLPKGTRPLAVYLEGVLKRVGTTKWYTVTDDGYQKSVKAAVAPGAAAQVDVLVVRE